VPSEEEVSESIIKASALRQSQNRSIESIEAAQSMNPFQKGAMAL
jgi:hypothetical protein